ncbi:hypothetical protein HUJ04_012022 [Dendroctonus ponderosae]|nr:hypothetical protein HUJ04_012022 [Dendroctonus ponderosae]
MTVQDKTTRAMPQTAATRSRFMITDILNRPAEAAATAVLKGGRSPSPGPRDLSLSNPHHDSDTDSSGQPDNSSICSNVSSNFSITFPTGLCTLGTPDDRFHGHGPICALLLVRTKPCIRDTLIAPLVTEPTDRNC